VTVYPETREEKVSFNQLRKSDLSPIRYKKVAEVDDKEVPADQIVKGYEYEKGKWVVLEDKQFAQPVQRVKIGRVVSVKKRVESPLWADIELRPEYNLMALNAVMVFTKEGEREAPVAASARD